MKIATARLRGVSPMSQSFKHDTPKLEKETHDDYEKRTWRNKMHVTEDGFIFIPPMALKQALTEAAKMRGEQIPGRGKSTYTKHFEAGVLCMELVPIGVKAEDVKGEWIQANSDGVRGSGKRVPRCFPHIPPGWEATAQFMVVDDTVTRPVFERTLREAGSFVGIGRFRPRNGGYYGRFTVESVTWSEE